MGKSRFSNAKLLRLFKPADTIEQLLIPRLSVTLAWLLTLALPSIIARATENSLVLAFGSWALLALCEVALFFAERRLRTSTLVILSILTLAAPFAQQGDARLLEIEMALWLISNIGHDLVAVPLYRLGLRRLLEKTNF